MTGGPEFWSVVAQSANESDRSVGFRELRGLGYNRNGAESLSMFWLKAPAPMCNINLQRLRDRWDVNNAPTQHVYCAEDQSGRAIRGIQPYAMDRSEFSHWPFGILRGEISRSALRAALAAIRVWLQKLCDSLFLPRSACFTQVRLHFYTDRCRVYGQSSHACTPRLHRMRAQNYLPLQGHIGVCTPCMQQADREA